MIRILLHKMKANFFTPTHILFLSRLLYYAYVRFLMSSALLAVYALFACIFVTFLFGRGAIGFGR